PRRERAQRVVGNALAPLIARQWTGSSRIPNRKSGSHVVRCYKESMFIGEIRMLDRILNIGLWVSVALVVAILLINALYMVVSPTSWFALPRWLRLNGVLTLERYGGGWGALQVRILGVITVVTIGWVGWLLS